MTTRRSKFIFKAPFNALSFGQVSYNLVREMHRQDLDVSIFPAGETVDISCFGSELFDWIKGKTRNRYDKIDRDTKCLQLWHLRNSDQNPTSKSYLYTFHEINGTTPIERSICGLHEKVIFSSRFSAEKFAIDGVSTSLAHCPLGFDEDIVKLDKKYFEDEIHFVLIGKWEQRKNTELIIKTWIDLFGNKNGYRLTCLVENPFFSKEIMPQLMARALCGKDYFNVSFLPRLRTNAEMVDLYNSCDIDLSGLSSAEGWNLPAFNATCLGKWSCVANHTAHMDWATKENCVLVEPSGEKKPYDNTFFREGDEYNQGTIFSISPESIRSAMMDSVKLAKTPNLNGEALGKTMTYKNTLENLLNICEI